MSRKAKMDNANKLINIVATLLERQERLLQHIGDLEEYIEVLENLNEFEESDGMLIEFTPDEEFKDILVISASVRDILHIFGSFVVICS